MNCHEVLGIFRTPVAANNSVTLKQVFAPFNLQISSHLSLRYKYPHIILLPAYTLYTSEFEINFQIVQWSLVRILEISFIKHFNNFHPFILLKNVLQPMLHIIWNSRKEAISQRQLLVLYYCTKPLDIAYHSVYKSLKICDNTCSQAEDNLSNLHIMLEHIVAKSDKLKRDEYLN